MRTLSDSELQRRVRETLVPQPLNLKLTPDSVRTKLDELHRKDAADAKYRSSLKP